MKPFWERREWLALRYKVLTKYGWTCMACGRSRKDRAIIQVDHIKCRFTYPELALCEDNLQVLCRECNLGKSAEYDHDFRPKPTPYVRPPRKKVPKEFRRCYAIARLSRIVKNKLYKAEQSKDCLEQGRLMKVYLDCQRRMRTVRLPNT